MRLIRVLVLGVFLLGIEGCFNYQLIHPLSTSSNRVIIAGREKLSLEVGLTSKSLIPILQSDSIALLYNRNDTLKTKKLSSMGILMNFQLTKNINIGMEYSARSTKNQSWLYSRSGLYEQSWSYRDMSILFLLPRINDLPIRMGMLAKYAKSTGETLGQYLDLPYHGYVVGKSYTVFPFLSTSSVELEPFKIFGQIQVGYFAIQTQSTASYPESEAEIVTHSIIHGQKLQWAITNESHSYAFGVDYSSMSDGETYIGVNISHVINFGNNQ